mmetsp:Transcript_2659/g.6763  ORF Transcript_2659/g.6763 Transcript_2659/m.6763 type:complete len:350 (+) Transcript_2659:511-1560(+)
MPHLASRNKNRTPKRLSRPPFRHTTRKWKSSGPFLLANWCRSTLPSAAVSCPSSATCLKRSTASVLSMTACFSLLEEWLPRERYTILSRVRTRASERAVFSRTSWASTLTTSQSLFPFMSLANKSGGSGRRLQSSSMSHSERRKQRRSNFSGQGVASMVSPKWGALSSTPRSGTLPWRRDLRGCTLWSSACGMRGLFAGGGVRCRVCHRRSTAILSSSWSVAQCPTLELLRTGSTSTFSPRTTTATLTSGLRGAPKTSRRILACSISVLLAGNPLTLVCKKTSKRSASKRPPYQRTWRGARFRPELSPTCTKRGRACPQRPSSATTSGCPPALCPSIRMERSKNFSGFP